MGTDTATSTNHPFKYFILPGVIYKYVLYSENKETGKMLAIKCSDKYEDLTEHVKDLKSKKLGEYI